MALLDELKQELKNENLNNSLDSSEENIFLQAAKNAPSSAVQLGKDLITPVLNPIQTANSLKDLGVGIYQLFTPGVQPNEEIAKAVGRYFSNRYGGFDNIKNTFATDPAGFLADASILFTGGAGAAAKVPGLAGQTTQIVSNIGRSIDPITGAVKATNLAAQGAGKVIKEGLGLTTGAGGEAISQAYKAGRAGADAQRILLDNMRGNVPAEEVVQQATSKIKEISQSRKQKLKSGKSKLELDSKPVEFTKIRDGFDDFVKNKTFEGMSELSTKGQKKLESINKIIKEFESTPKLHNAQGMDILKRRIDAEYPTGINVGDSGMVVSTIRNNIKNQILKEVPEYGDVMKSYEEAISLEKQITKELSLGNKTAAGTALRKLQSVMRNNVNTNYGNRLEMVKNLDPQLLPALAGQSLSSAVPRGLQGITATGQIGAGALGLVDPLTLPITLSLQSPRLVGEAAVKAGQASNLLNKIPLSEALRTTRPIVPALEESQEQKQLNYLNSLLNN